MTRGPTTSQQINSAIDEIRDILGSTQPKPNVHRSGIEKGGDTPAWYQRLVDKKKWYFLWFYGNNLSKGSIFK